MIDGPARLTLSVVGITARADVTHGVHLGGPPATVWRGQVNGMDRRMGTFNVQTFDGARIRRLGETVSAGPSAAAEDGRERMNEPTERQREPPHSEAPVDRVVWECRRTLTERAVKEN